MKINHQHTQGAHWHTSVILVLGNLRLEDYEFEDSMGYTLRPSKNTITLFFLLRLYIHFICILVREGGGLQGLCYSDCPKLLIEPRLVSHPKSFTSVLNAEITGATMHKKVASCFFLIVDFSHLCFVVFLYLKTYFLKTYLRVPKEAKPG